MPDIKKEDLIEKKDDSTSETPEQKIVGDENEAKGLNRDGTPKEQDPLTTELDRIKKKDPKTELEKAQRSLHFNAERVRELGGDPTAILKPDDVVVEEDDKPVTVGMLRKLQQEGAARSAIQLAEEIQTESERELVKWHLANTIKSTGNPSEDLKLARAIVNSVKNGKITEEVIRKDKPKSHSSGSGAPAKDNNEVKGELTPQETLFMKPPFNMSKEAILKARIPK